MTAKGNKPPLALDMDFGEAMARFAQTEPLEVQARIEDEKRAKKLEKKKAALKPPSES